MSRDQFSAIYHAGSSLTGARLKRARNEWSPGAPERQELPPAEPAAEGDAVQTGASPEVRRFTASFTDSVTYCLESRAAQFQFLSLPPADESEIRGMVELELEQRKILPLELDKMTLAIEPLSKSEDAMRLLVAAVPTEKLDEIHAKTGLSPARLHRIDIAALATVADIVPLQGENRAIVKIGLDMLLESAFRDERVRIKIIPFLCLVCFVLILLRKFEGVCREVSAG